MRLEIQLPKHVEVDDYHELQTIESHLKLIDKKFRVKEVAFYHGQYHGIIYEYGFAEDPVVQALIDEIKREEKRA